MEDRGAHLVVRLGGVRDGEETGRKEEGEGQGAAAEHLVGSEIWAEGGGLSSERARAASS